MLYGQSRFHFVGQPLEKGKALVKLDVKVKDKAQHSELITRTFPVAASGIQLELVPEAGRVVPGLENVVISFRDVTARLRAEDELRQSQFKYRNLFEASKDAVFITALEGRVLEMNWAARELFGLGEAESSPMNAASLFEEEREWDRFRGVLVADDPTPYARGRFTLVTPDNQEGGVQGVRFGLEDQSGRLNLNLLPILDKRVSGSGRKILMALPGTQGFYALITAILIGMWSGLLGGHVALHQHGERQGDGQDGLDQRYDG